MTTAAPDALSLPGSWQEPAIAFGKRALLGAAAGGAGGMLIGGVGGRLAMFLLRLTSPDYIVGVESDDGFEMGVVSMATFNLIAITGILGSLAGLFVALSLRFMPAPWVPWAWAAPGVTMGGSLIIHGDGVDFALLSPLWLAVLLFLAIPALGLVCIGLLIRRWEPWWWTARRQTAFALMAAWPIVAFFPIGIAVVAFALAWGVLARQEGARLLADSPFARHAATVGFGGVTLVFLPLLIKDVLDVF
jgi:hypothetical protein